MNFVFYVDGTGKLPTARICYLTGRLESGTIKGGELATVEGFPGQQLQIRSVALVSNVSTDVDAITLAVEEPDFAINELIGKRLIG